MRFATLTLAAFLSSAMAVQAQPKPSPAFAAFLKFCADPHMTAQGVRVKVEGAGGTVFVPEKNLSFPFKSSTSSWHATAQSHKFLISLIDGHVPAGPDTMQEFVTCTITDEGRGDNTTKSELKQWVGSAPDSTVLGLETYHFEWDGQKRTPPPSGNVYRADSDKGKIWRLMVSDMGGLAMVRLERSLKATRK